MAVNSGERIAVVLFNLGGPDRGEAVEPFLFNLFRDPAIIRVPNPLRWLIAKTISRRRAPTARAIYERIGGRSPILENTRRQAEALAEALSDLGGVRVFVSMRYWHPMSAETARAVAGFAPDRVVLLPLYPQFSTTTTGSSFGDWAKSADSAGIRAETVSVCCYPAERGFVAALAAGVRRGLTEAREAGPARVLFSAHGLPQKVVDGGDPYAWQVGETAKAVVAALGEPGLDWQICYQSRVGPLEWLKPYTEDALREAGKAGKPVVVVPLAFVSEHSETLVELDIEYREAAAGFGVPKYVRVPTVSAEAAFVDGLAASVRAALARTPGLASASDGRLCPAAYSGCPVKLG